ncbi:MAG: HlyD family efflux transporter periplasmic adaptor subunit [Gammaproteobacteria bacterium]
MSKQSKPLVPLSDALENHSAEGIAILASEPSPYMRGLVYSMVGLLMAGLAWSFVGRADVIVNAVGVLGPESEVRRFYSPVEGELVDIYIAEGSPVSAGDVLARINARGAIEVAARALNANLELADAQREYESFPRRKALMARQAAALQRQIAAEERLHEKRILEGTSKLSEAQRAKLSEARAELQLARRELGRTRQQADKFARLSGGVGGGGISRQTVDDARNAYLTASTAYQLAEARLSELDFSLSSEYAQADAALQTSDRKVTQLRLDHEALLEKIEREERQVEVELSAARLAAEAAQRVTFDNIDEDNFLRVLAPIAGVVTEVPFTQPGDKISAHSPLGGIAPENARAIVRVEIDERDRAFLREGLPVKLKFNAFPYERYGYIEGTLEYISPDTQRSTDGTAAIYKGHVGLKTDHFTIEQTAVYLRYGMAAKAEIVVRKRRLIDLALDPFRKAFG